MYSILCCDHTAAEEVLTILENNGMSGHIDGKEVKTNAEITDEGIAAEIFPWKAYQTREVD